MLWWPGGALPQLLSRMAGSPRGRHAPRSLIIRFAIECFLEKNWRGYKGGTLYTPHPLGCSALVVRRFRCNRQINRRGKFLGGSGLRAPAGEGRRVHGSAHEAGPVFRVVVEEVGGMCAVGSPLKLERPHARLQPFDVAG
jgi:hypothetical protein